MSLKLTFSASVSSTHVQVVVISLADRSKWKCRLRLHHGWRERHPHCELHIRSLTDTQCFSIQEFVTHKGDELNDFHVPSIVAVAVAFGTSTMHGDTQG